MDKEQNNLIVIAEDSPTQAEKLKFTLNGFGYEVAHGINGKEAFDLTKKHLPIMIITDILMPEMDGYELCRKIKADEKLRQIPVVLLTVLTDSTDILNGLECGADNYIMKPYDEKYLLTHLQSIIANRHILKEDQVKTEINISFSNKEYSISLTRFQILGMLLSTYQGAVKKIREINKEIPIIAQTAFAGTDDKELILDTGCNDYISKPIDKDLLIKLVGKYV